MSINRYNYEEYFLLYVDNELPAEDRAAVEKFVGEHPDLGQELELLKQAVLRPERQQVFTNKEALMRSSQVAGCINESNSEEYFISYIDNELSTPDKAAVEAYLFHHPEAAETFQLLQQAKLQPEKMAFPGKEHLYRRESDRKVVFLNWWKFAAAAIVIFVAGWIWLNKEPDTSRDHTIAERKRADTEKRGARVEQVSPSVKQEKTTVTEEIRNTSKATEAISVPMPKNTVAANAIPYGGKSKNGSTETKPPLENRLLKTAQVKLVTTTLPGRELPAYRKEPLKSNPEGSIKTPQLAENMVAAEIPEDNNATVAFTSDTGPENVILTNIPVNGNMPLRGLRRKASRLIHIVASIKNGSRRGISIGNVEITIQ